MGATDEGATDEGATDEGATDEGATDETSEAASVVFFLRRLVAFGGGGASGVDSDGIEGATAAISAFWRFGMVWFCLTVLDADSILIHWAITASNWMSESC